MIGFGQLTYVPDDNFENYLETNGMGDGIPLNDSIFTSAIDTVTGLDVNNQSISDFTGIEDFFSLISFICSDNIITYLDISQNYNLEFFMCWNCSLQNIDVSANVALTHLVCGVNDLITLDVSNNINLIELICSHNDIIFLNISNNIYLTELACANNSLLSLDARNGNNTNMQNGFWTIDNPNLTCIDVDDDIWSTLHWTASNGDIDPQHYFSNNCSGTAIEEHSTNKELLRTIDILGRETKSHPLFYIYDDGTVEKKIIME